MNETYEWTKSSYSDGGGGNCMEWAAGSASAEGVPVRDSKAPEGARLIFGADAWRSFVTAVKSDGLRSR